MDNAEYVSRFRALIGALDRLLPGPRTVLDYGCGPGPVLIELLRQGGDMAIGYDPHFAPQLDPEATFDAVVSTETFEHFSDPSGELRRIMRLLRPGGILAVMTQLHPGEDVISGWWYARDPTHVCFYSRRTMDWIAGHFSLDLLECDGVRMTFFRTA